MLSKPIFFANKIEIPEGVEFKDCYKSALRELFFVRHPRYKKLDEESQKHLDSFISRAEIDDVYIYLPWRNLVIRTVGERWYLELRTARNRNLISSTEQEQYRNFKIGIIGLSIGSGALNSLVRTGGPKTIKIADHDDLEITNLNRLNATIADLGVNKSHIAMRNVYEVDPFADVYVYDKGVDEASLEDFVLGRPRLDCVIDALDNLRIKFLLRDICRANRIPLIMGTDIGDNVILDIERHDLDYNYPAFHGAIGEMTADGLRDVPYKEWVKIATKIVDPNIMPASILNSIKDIGKLIAGVPQLGSTVAITGALTSQAVRMIACGQNLKSGRYVLNVEDLLNEDLRSAVALSGLRTLRDDVLRIIT